MRALSRSGVNRNGYSKQIERKEKRDGFVDKIAVSLKLILQILWFWFS